MEREGLITIERQKNGLTSISISVLIVVSLVVAWTVFKIVPVPDWNIQESKRQSIPFLAATITLGLLLVFTSNFIFSYSYKIDLLKNELLFQKHFPFWTKTKTERITKKKIINVGQEKETLHGTFIIVQINDRTIKLYDNLHSNEVKIKMDYLKKYGF
jgi:hypothetical protein